MPERSFSAYLTESLARIEHDAPQVYAQIGLRLGRRVLSIEVSGELLGVSAERGRLVLGPVRDGALVSAVTSRRDIIALADGERTLEQAAVEERVKLVGSAEDLAISFDALAAYLNGAARSPDLGALMDAFRRDVG